jgi:hypothetical protein
MSPPAHVEVDVVVVVPVSRTQFPFTQIMPGTVPVQPPEVVVGSEPVG